jgi:hypothetical protein
MKLLISPQGAVHCVYSEAIDLTTVGRLAISRGSYVEPNAAGQWLVDLSPVDGPQLGPFAQVVSRLPSLRTDDLILKLVCPGPAG